ncbi:ATPase, partial [Thermococci archaeon]
MEVLQTSENGLTLTEVENRLKEYGPNEIEEKGKSILWMFSKQFLNSLILILLLASLVSFFLGEKIDAIIIVMIVLLMGIMGFAQEYSAEKTIESLKELASPTCIVVRNGREMEVQSSSLVPGDLIVLREGDRVPADSRLI